MTFDTVKFREALGAFVTGVTIVTTRAADGTDVGLTANSFNSVSLDPPLVLWSLALTAASREAFTHATHFAVHILAAGQEELSNRFAKRGEDKFSGLTLERGAAGVPLLEGCSARFECRTAYQYEGGDHIIFVGEVLSFFHYASPPLAYHAGRYAVAAHRPPASAPETSSANNGSFSEDFLGYLLGRAHYQLYAKIMPHLLRFGLSEAEHFILSVLGNGDGRTASDIDAVIAYTGVRVTPALVETLTARGLLLVSESPSGARLWLTPLGRQMMIELIAVAKAAEADAQTQFETNEIRTLKQLLKQLINSTDPGLPSPWSS